MEKLLVNETFIKRIITLKEVNISFLMRDDNLFDIGMSKALEIFTVKYKEGLKDKIANNILDRLFTAIVSLKDKPYIQYQKSSCFCEQIANKLKGLLFNFYDKKKNFNDKRGTVLILDRSFDVSAPLLHDYYYGCMIHDLFDVKDNLLNYNGEHKFDEDDHLWKKYKAKHLAEAMGEMQKDFRVFMDSDLSKVQTGSESLDNFEKMSGAMQGMKAYKKQSKNFGVHLRLVQKMNEVSKDT